MSITDQELIARYRNGERLALDDLVARYLSIVYSFVKRYVYDQETAEDVTQETFIKVIRHLKRYDARKPFKPWILQIAKHQAFDILKKQSPLLASEMEDTFETDWLTSIPDPRPLADEATLLCERQREVTQAIHHLSKTEQRIFFLRYHLGWSFREIADELHELIDTVKSQHRRFLLKLRKRLGTF